MMAALTIASTPAAANKLHSAEVVDDCTGYTITFTNSFLAIGKQYEITWQINGLPKVVNDQVTFTATSHTFTTTVTKTWADYGITLNGAYSLSGTARLVGYNHVPIAFNPTMLNCPSQCKASTTNSSNFNGTPINAGNYIWFNANFTASGIPSGGGSVSFQNQTISFTADKNYNLPVPDAQINFSPTASCTSSTFDTATNTWIVTVPVSGDDEILLSGLTFPVPTGFTQVQGNVTWQGTMSSNVPGVSVQWKWGAAVYTTFSSDYNILAVKPGHNASCSYRNGDHAGTPEGDDPLSGSPFKDFVIGGARGGGGSNWTGSWSGTVQVKPQCP
jgi:hypothetical protein